MVASDEDRIYEVVQNIHDQYSIWLQYKPLPTGWRLVGRSGTKADCLEHIDRVWTDMTPAYVRKLGGGSSSAE